MNEIVFSNKITEANNNCFVFVIKSEQSFDKKSSNKGKLTDHQLLLEISNPSLLLYGICFKIKDLVESKVFKNFIIFI